MEGKSSGRAECNNGRKARVEEYQQVFNIRHEWVVPATGLAPEVG